MTPEILAKIMGIVAKGGERVIVIDPRSGTPVVLLNLEAYEKMVFQGVSNTHQASQGVNLTPSKGPGILDPDLALWQEAAKGAGGWGGDEPEEKEEDRYYMEPTE